jgi:hypothetical protein
MFLNDHVSYGPLPVSFAGFFFLPPTDVHPQPFTFEMQLE